MLHDQSPFFLLGVVYRLNLILSGIAIYKINHSEKTASEMLHRNSKSRYTIQQQLQYLITGILFNHMV